MTARAGGGVRGTRHVHIDGDRAMRVLMSYQAREPQGMEPKPAFTTSTPGAFQRFSVTREVHP